MCRFIFFCLIEWVLELILLRKDFLVPILCSLPVIFEKTTDTITSLQCNHPNHDCWRSFLFVSARYSSNRWYSGDLPLANDPFECYQSSSSLNVFLLQKESIVASSVFFQEFFRTLLGKTFMSLFSLDRKHRVRFLYAWRPTLTFSGVDRLKRLSSHTQIRIGCSFSGW